MTGTNKLDVRRPPPGFYILVHFYKGSHGLPLGVWLWNTLTRPLYIHASIELNGVLLFNLPYKGRSYWCESQSQTKSRPPDQSIALSIPEGFQPWLWRRAVGDVEEWRTDRLGSAWRYLTGRGRPKNCTSSVCRLLRGLGFYADSFTPDQLWRELSETYGQWEAPVYPSAQAQGCHPGAG